MHHRNAIPLSPALASCAANPGRLSTRRLNAAVGAVWILLSLIFASLAVRTFGLGLLLLYATSAVVSAGLAARRLRRPGGRVVLVYHSVSDNQAWLPWSDQIAVTPSTLYSQLALLKRLGFEFITTQEHLVRRGKRKAKPDRSIVVHFDDGYLDNWVAAAPILRRLGIPATLFISLDFVEPGADRRATLDVVEQGDAARESLEWRGYMNWPEIAMLEACPLFDIQPHGVDHARVPISDQLVSLVSPANWRPHAWLQWRGLPGDEKSGWWRHTSPPVVPVGGAIPVSAPALSAPAWLGTRFETGPEFEDRVRMQLSACIEAFRKRLGKTPAIFCWPENATNDVARRVAAELGFCATTAGTGENRLHEHPAVISRLHVGDRTLGFRCRSADLLHLYASVRCFQGCYYWYYPLLLMHGVRGVVARVSRWRLARKPVDAYAG